MKITVEDGVTVISNVGLFDHNAAQKFSADVTNNIGEKLPPYVLVDLSEATGVLSAAIVELIALQDAVRDKGGEMVLCGLSRIAEAAIKSANLDQLFRVAPGVEDGMKVLREEMEI